MSILVCQWTAPSFGDKRLSSQMEMHLFFSPCCESVLHPSRMHVRWSSDIFFFSSWKSNHKNTIICSHQKGNHLYFHVYLFCSPWLGTQETDIRLFESFSLSLYLFLCLFIHFLDFSFHTRCVSLSVRLSLFDVFPHKYSMAFNVFFFSLSIFHSSVSSVCVTNSLHCRRANYQPQLASTTTTLQVIVRGG